MLARDTRGFTLVELAVGLAVLGILLAVGVPIFSQMIHNARLRGAAEAFSATLQLARGEAIARNSRVELVMTDDEPVAAMVNAANVLVGGPNWIVRAFNVTTGFNEFVQGKSSLEGSSEGGTTVVVAPTDGTTNIIAFNAFGGTTLGAAVTFQFINPAGGVCVAASGPMRCLNVVVTPGGQIRMCDPSVTTVGDTRKC